MARSSMWDGAQWVSMTGGVGDEGGGSEPDDNYLRLDGANNPLSPANFLRTTDADLLYLKLAGGAMTGDLNINNNHLHGIAQIADSTDANAYFDGSLNASVSSSQPGGLGTTLTFRANEIRVAQIFVSKDGTGIYMRGIDGNGPTWGAWEPIATHTHVANNFAPIVHNHDGVYLPMSGGILTGPLGVSGGGTYIDANAIEIGSGQGSGGQSYIDFHANDDTQPDRMGRILVDETSMAISLRGLGTMRMDTATGVTLFDHSVQLVHAYLGGGADTDGQVIMTTRMGRNWSLRQRGTGAGAHLELMGESNKNFYIGSDPNGDYMEFGAFGNINRTAGDLGSLTVRNTYIGASTPSGVIKGDIWMST